MAETKEYFVGKLLTYNEDGVIRSIEDIKTLAGGPEKELVKQLTLDTFLGFYPDFQQTISSKDFTNDELDIKPHGYLLKVETVLVQAEEPVLAIL